MECLRGSGVLVALDIRLQVFQVKGGVGDRSLEGASKESIERLARASISPTGAQKP